MVSQFPKIKSINTGTLSLRLHSTVSERLTSLLTGENRDWGGAFACYRGLTESLPYHRLFNSPISEALL